ncbi:MAG: hypothetical protein EHM87_24380 [Burkholderiales bacterium]|nr:MAG: hypothetical protein EHM87_24380 [Burkholderiales bacterium]
MDPLLMYGLTTAGGGLLNMLNEKLRGKTEQEKLYEWLQEKAKTPASELGLTPAEKNAARFGTKNRLQRSSAERYAAGAASAARRGGTLSKQAGMDIEGDYATAYGDFLPELDMYSDELGRKRKAGYEDQLVNLGMAMPDTNTDITGDIGNISKNIMMYLLMKNRKPDLDAGDGFSSSNFLAGLG